MLPPSARYCSSPSFSNPSVFLKIAFTYLQLRSCNLQNLTLEFLWLTNSITAVTWRRSSVCCTIHLLLHDYSFLRRTISIQHISITSFLFQTHICVWFDSTSGTCGTYSNGLHSETRHCSRATVTGGGSFMLAQDQDNVGGSLDSNQVLQYDLKPIKD